MVEITTLFWDVGGVILTNGWDLDIRRRAAEHFNLDWEEMEERHERVLADFEAGRLSLFVHRRSGVEPGERTIAEHAYDSLSIPRAVA